MKVKNEQFDLDMELTGSKLGKKLTKMYIPISLRIFQFIVIHTVKGFGIVNKAEIDVFLELSCFFHDLLDVGNCISGSSDFSKSSLNIWSSRFKYC